MTANPTRRFGDVVGASAIPRLLSAVNTSHFGVDRSHSMSISRYFQLKKARAYSSMIFHASRHCHRFGGGSESFTAIATRIATLLVDVH